MRALPATWAAKGSLLVWSALVALTVLTAALGEDRVIDNGTLAAVVVIGVTTVKIRLIGLHFMELRTAPPALRVFFESYCAALFLALTGIYLVA